MSKFTPEHIELLKPMMEWAIVQGASHDQLIPDTVVDEIVHDALTQLQCPRQLLAERIKALEKAIYIYAREQGIPKKVAIQWFLGEYGEQGRSNEQ